MNRIEIEVDRLYRQLPGKSGDLCEFPVIGGGFIKGVDRTSRERELACRALAAREWFGQHGPADAPPLPLSDVEMEDLRYKGNALWHIIAHFAQSLRSLDWDVARHPCFDDFAGGVLASKTAPDFILEDEVLRRRYPPRPLAGLSPFFIWKPSRGARTRRLVS